MITLGNELKVKLGKETQVFASKRFIRFWQSSLLLPIDMSAYITFVQDLHQGSE